MRTIFAIIAAVSLLAVGTMAFAHGNGGSGGWGSGHMGQNNGRHMSQGYGGQMGQQMGQGNGRHMGQGYGKGGGSGTEVNQEFMDKTADLRKEIHTKRFEYREAARNPETTNKELRNIEKDIFDIQTKIQEIVPRSAYNGNGPCRER